MLTPQQKDQELIAEIAALRIETHKLGGHPLMRDDINIIAVSKNFPTEAIMPFIELGYRNFGENRLQEAQDKWVTLKAEYPECRLHFLGGLQSKKVKDVLKLFDVIHSVDRLKLLPLLADEIGARNYKTEIFLQINISDEAQKSGIPLEQADEFIQTARDAYKLNIVGLMGMAKMGEPSAPYFALLHEINKKHKLPYLSMGMSNDFADALKFGASHIRIGTYLFGERMKAQ